MHILTRLQYSGEIYSDRGYDSIPKGELILAGRCVLWRSYFIATGSLLCSILEKVFWTPQIVHYYFGQCSPFGAYSQSHNACESPYFPRLGSKGG